MGLRCVAGSTGDQTLNRYTSRFWPLGQNKTVPCHDLETALRPQYIRGVDCMGVHKPATAATCAGGGGGISPADLQGKVCHTCVGEGR
jgi:hypothetical protein